MKTATFLFWFCLVLALVNIFLALTFHYGLALFWAALCLFSAFMHRLALKKGEGPGGKS